MSMAEDDFARVPPGPPISKSALLHDILLQEEQDDLPFSDVTVRFHRRCQFCSGKHCSKYFKNAPTTPCCLKFREHVYWAPTRDECKYIRCPDRKTHHVTVCPHLHSKCPVCKLRGHDANDRCDIGNPAIMSRLRSDFEQAAPLGFHTKHRRDNLEWGFYHFTKDCFKTTRHPVDYLELNRMAVLDAVATVQAICLAAAYDGPSADAAGLARSADNNNNSRKRSRE